MDWPTLNNVYNSPASFCHELVMFYAHCGTNIYESIVYITLFSHPASMAAFLDLLRNGEQFSDFVFFCAHSVRELRARLFFVRWLCACSHESFLADYRAVRPLLLDTVTAFAPHKHSFTFLTETTTTTTTIGIDSIIIITVAKN
jgi:hypothetical protein